MTWEHIRLLFVLYQCISQDFSIRTPGCTSKLFHYGQLFSGSFLKLVCVGVTS